MYAPLPKPKAAVAIAQPERAHSTPAPPSRPVGHAADAMVNSNTSWGGPRHLEEHYVPASKKASPLPSAVSKALAAAELVNARHSSQAMGVDNEVVPPKEPPVPFENFPLPPGLPPMPPPIKEPPMPKPVPPPIKEPPQPK